MLNTFLVVHQLWRIDVSHQERHFLRCIVRRYILGPRDVAQSPRGRGVASERFLDQRLHHAWKIRPRDENTFAPGPLRKKFRSLQDRGIVPPTVYRHSRNTKMLRESLAGFELRFHSCEMLRERFLALVS